MSRFKPLVSICCECEYVYKGEVEGLYKDFLDATIQTFFWGDKLEDHYLLSHGYCSGCLEKKMKEVLEDDS